MHDLVTAAPEEVGLSAERLTRVGRWMDRLVEDGKLPGVSVMVMRRGQIAYFAATGHADIGRRAPMQADTIVRVYSMTKPLTSVAVMLLYEEGRFQLDDPITRFLPEFADMRVAVGGSRGKVESAPAERDITIRDLLTHTSGLTYGFMEAGVVDALYRERGVDFQTSPDTLAEVVARAAALPLIAQPGRAWNYSIATDVLGHLVAVVSGKGFAEFLAERVIGPLGMVDTGFDVPAGKIGRFAANYTRGPDGALLLIDDPRESRYGTPRRIASGGGGLVSTGLRLHALLPDDAGQRRAGGHAAARAQDGGADDRQPPRRRHGGDGDAAVFRKLLCRDRLRARLLGHARPGGGADRRHAGRIRLGGCGEHRVLVRPGRGHGGGAADAAHAVLDVSDPQGASGADVSGDRGLRRLCGHQRGVAAHRGDAGEGDRRRHREKARHQPRGAAKFPQQPQRDQRGEAA